jgi:hypothetical protein
VAKSPKVGILTGTDKVFGFLNDEAQQEVLAKEQQLSSIGSLGNRGIHGNQPGATPKYAINKGRRDQEYRDTLARLFIDLPPNTYKQFLDSLPKETQPLAQVLANEGRGVGGTGFIDFILVNTQEGFEEKSQIVDTLTDNYVAFYTGQAPPLFQYSGTLFNTYQDDQRVWMLRLYRDILRGSKLANRNLIARLKYDSFIVSGYLESLVLGLNADTETAGTFQFAMRVKHMTVFTEALGAPTVVSSPATDKRVFETTVISPVARSATLMPETPPTAQPAFLSFQPTPQPEFLSFTAQEQLVADSQTKDNPENVTQDGTLVGLTNTLGFLDTALGLVSGSNNPFFTPGGATLNTSAETIRVPPRTKGAPTAASTNK